MFKSSSSILNYGPKAVLLFYPFLLFEFRGFHCHTICMCSVAFPHGAVGWSAVCDCGIF